MNIKNILTCGAVLGAVFAFVSPSLAESTEEMCNRISIEWQSTGDVASQCSCLGAKGDANAALNEEIWAVTKTASNDDEAYEQSSDALKAVLDECAVEH